MLAEFFCACIGIVVGAIPIDRGVFLAYFARALSGYGNSADVADAAEAVLVPAALGELDDFERAAEIYVEAAFFGLAIQGCGAVDYRVRSADELRIVVVGKAEMRVGEIATKNADACVQKFVEARKIQMELQSAPEPFLRFLFIPGANEQIQRVGMTRKQIRRDVRADISGGTGQEDGHSN